MKVMISGANGFVGGALLKKLQILNVDVRGVVRTGSFDCESDIKWVAVGDIDSSTDWSLALKDVDVVVHCAARVHVMHDNALNPLDEFRKTNVEGTLNLALQAAKAGVKRLIFLSTVKVNGESTSSDNMFLERDIPKPVDAYGISKWEAEEALRSVSANTEMEVVVIRPPLIYGPDVKGNFQSLMKLAKTGIPLPFGSIQNSRSMVYVENLTDFIVTALDHPAAANETFFISDNEALSTRHLLQNLRISMGLHANIFSIPVIFFYKIGRLTKTSEIVDRLCGSLRVDNSKAKTKLNWTAPFTVQDGLEETAKCWLKKCRKGPNEGYMLTRFFDIVFSILGLSLGLPFLILFIIIGFFDTGSPIFKQTRVGRNQRPFRLIKFRTMSVGTASVASHLVESSNITKFGHFLRKTKLDELPQLWNVLIGDMSLVGPRPCLFNQLELIDARQSRHVFDVLPGITGLAQINEIDMSTPELLADTDERMILTFSLKSYFHYILQTAFGKGQGDRVRINSK